MRTLGVYHSLAAILIFGFAAFAVADILSGTASVGSSSNITLTQLPISKPATVAIGDLMLASIALRDGSESTVTPPDGWTLIQRTDNGTDVGIVTFFKFAAADEPSSYTWTLTPQTRSQGGITHYSGVDTEDPIEIAAGLTGRGKTATSPPVTVSAGAMTVAAFALPVGSNNHAGNWFATPTGMTEKFDASYTPSGPTAALFDAIQAVAGTVEGRSSKISGSSNRDWASQHIALRTLTPQQDVTADDFDAYADGDLNGLDGGTGWTSAWTGDTRFDVQGSVTFEGDKAIVVNVPGGQQPAISRTFAPKTSGTLHWAQRKDAPDHGANLRLLSGNTLAVNVGIGSATQPQANGPYWYTHAGVLQFYPIGTFETVDVEYDTTTDQFRISIDGGTYSTWMNFLNEVSSVDTIQIDISASGSNVGNNYWDDIRFDN